MKRILSFFMILIATLTLIGCGGNNKSSETVTPTEGPKPLPTEEPLEPSDTPVGFKIHYHRDDNDYKEWGVWLWAEGVDTIEGKVWEFNQMDDFGACLAIKFTDFGEKALETSLGFIVRKLSSWTKDVDKDRFYEFATGDMDIYGYYNIYLKSKDPAIYASGDGREKDMITSFFTEYTQAGNLQLKLTTNNEFVDYEIRKNGEVVGSKTVGADKIFIDKNKLLTFDLGTEFPDLSDSFECTIEFKDSHKKLVEPANMMALYHTEQFQKAFNYDGELGAIYTPEKTTFRVWSPVSREIKLRIYDTGTPLRIAAGGEEVAMPGGSDNYSEHIMNKGPKGTWELELLGDYSGKYYTYVVTNGKYKNQECVDPYAKSAGINGLRGMVVDFSKTNPEGWDEVKLNGKSRQELVVYETHIADLTSSRYWNGKPENARNFVGFAESGTSYQGVTTGFDHIKELGVNAVQILPLFDAANDERIGHRKFNWGYDPLNYNVPDGVYSKNPEDGYERIKEFKYLVKEYSKAGINIIMDVVYNHTAGLNKTNFDILMPNYYYRYVNGAAANGSGCGSETASNMYMFRKFMIDSTMFWAKEYKLGGFRFDLMGLHDIETMNLLSKNLQENVDPTITVYGEPWHAGSVQLPAGSAATQNNMNYYDGYGCFNDRVRDALMKGGMSAVTERGWVANQNNKLRADVNVIKDGIRGLVINGNSEHEVYKTVNYVTCHDNYTLFDRLKAAGVRDYELNKQMAMLAQSVILTSQGINFMLAGEEFLRTKGGNHNSYNASYFVNELDWGLKVQNIEMFKNYKKLIALHTSTDLFCKDNITAKHIKISVSNDCNLITYELKDTINNRIYKITHANGYEGQSPRAVDYYGYTLYLDTLNTENLQLGYATPISSFQTIIAYKQL